MTLAADTHDARRRDSQFSMHPWSPLQHDGRPTIVRAESAHVWDDEGRRYLDASSLSTTVGYAHPRVIEAATRQMGVLHGVDLSTTGHPLVGELAERIASFLPEDMSRTIFLNGGSEGLEAALFIATRYWQLRGSDRRRVVVFERGYHGSTLLTRTLSGLPATAHDLESPIHVDRIPLPATGSALRTPQACESLLRSFTAAIEQEDPPLAVVIEPFLNVGGGVVLPQGFLQGLRDICTRTGTLLVMDEVFTGIARSGRMFAFEHENAVPDILITSKGLGGGYIPISAVTTTQSIYDEFAKDPYFGGFRYGHTTSGHAVACAAALAVLDVVEEDGLVIQAADGGQRLVNSLLSCARHQHVTDVRGLGMVAVLELTDAGTATLVRAAARDRGVLLRQQGEAVFVVPPLNATTQVLDEIAECVSAAVKATAYGSES